MSVSTTTDRVTYAGDNSTTAFSFPYVLFANSDLKVYLKNNTTGAETLKTITTHYTISGTQTNGVYESGVTVTFLTAPTASETVLIYRDRSVTQDLELDENGKIPSLSLEKQLDKLATDIQRVKNKLARSVSLKEGFTDTFTPDLPALMVNDGYLKTNSAGDGFEYVEEQDLINTINTSSSSFTASRALVSDANGLADVSAVTATELGYLSGVTGQLSGNAQSATLTNKTIDADSNTITNIENADIKAGANIAHNKMAALTASRAVVTDANGVVSVTATTATQIGYLSGATSAITGDTQSSTHQNKTFDNTNTFTVRDDRFTLQDNSDTTKQVNFQLSGITTGTTRTITVADASIEIGKAPTVQRFTSGSGTYTTPAGVRYIVVEMVGGGGGGGGSGTTSGTAATAGGNTTFGSSLLTANGGAVGARFAGGGGGGSATVNSPAVALHAVSGGSGTGSGTKLGTTDGQQNQGGEGGSSALGGGGGGGTGSGPGAGQNAATNTGGGGGGAGMNNVASSSWGSGGGAGAYVKAMITSPDATYAYAVGAGGNGQAAGTSGAAGGNGGSGVIVVTEYYN